MIIMGMSYIAGCGQLQRSYLSLRAGCSGVNLGRTALDIKASLGAEPQRLVLHERMKNPIVHRLARWAARASAPKQPPLKRAWKEEQASVVEVKAEAMEDYSTPLGEAFWGRFPATPSLSRS